MLSSFVAGALVVSLALPLTVSAQSAPARGQETGPLEIRRSERESTSRRPVVKPPRDEDVREGARGRAGGRLGEGGVGARAVARGLLARREVVAPAAIRRLMRLVSAVPDTLVVVDNAENVAELGREAASDGVTVDVLVDIDVGSRRTGMAPGDPALALARAVVAQPSLRFRGLQGYAGHCAHVMGWEARREASRGAMTPLMDTRALIEYAGLPGEIVAGGSTGSWDIDVELPGLTELQAGSYCVMDIDYRRIGGRSGAPPTQFEMALTVIATVVSVPTSDRAMVDGGLKAFSTDKPFPPESVERPGVEYAVAGRQHGPLTTTDPSPAAKL